VAARARAIEYAIRDVIAKAEQIKRKGKRIFYLNIGDPVAFDFSTPPHIRKALVEAVQAGQNFYSPSEGVPELREAITDKEKRVNGIDIQADLYRRLFPPGF